MSNIKIARELLKIADSLVDKGKEEFKKYYAKERKWLTENGFKESSTLLSWSLETKDYTIDVDLPWKTEDDFVVTCYNRFISDKEREEDKNLQQAVRKAVSKMRTKTDKKLRTIQNEYKEVQKKYQNEISVYESCISDWEYLI